MSTMTTSTLLTLSDDEQDVLCTTTDGNYDDIRPQISDGDEEDMMGDVGASLMDTFESNNPPSFERLPFRLVTASTSSSTMTASADPAAATTKASANAPSPTVILTTLGGDQNGIDKLSQKASGKVMPSESVRLDDMNNDGDVCDGDFSSSLWSSQELREIGNWIERQVSPSTETFDASIPSLSTLSSLSMSSSSSFRSTSLEYTKPWDPNVKYTWYIVVQPDSTFHMKLNGEGSFLILQSDEILDSVRSVGEDHDSRSEERLNFLIYLATSRMYMLVEQKQIEHVLKDVIRCDGFSTTSSSSRSLQQNSQSNSKTIYFRSHGFRGGGCNQSRPTASGPGIKLHLGIGSAWKFVTQHRRRRVKTNHSYRNTVHPSKAN